MPLHLPTGGTHPDLAAHNDLGLATQDELDDLAAAKANASHAHIDADIPTGIARDSEVATAVSDHAALADPHIVYQKESEKNSANGYAPLDSGILVPIANLPVGTGAAQIAAGNHSHAGGAATYIKKTADQAVTSASFTSDNTLTFNPASNTDYHIKLFVIWQSVLTTVGARFAFLLPTAGVSLAWFRGAQQITASAAASTDMFTEAMLATSDNDIVTAVAAAEQLTNQLTMFEGVLRMGAGATGPFALRIQSELAANAITIKAGSFLSHQTF